MYNHSMVKRHACITGTCMYIYTETWMEAKQTKISSFGPGGLPDRCLHVVDTCVRVVTFTNTTD